MCEFKQEGAGSISVTLAGSLVRTHPLDVPIVKCILFIF